MSVEVEVIARIAFHHLAHVLHTLQGIHDAERVGEHVSVDGFVAKRIEQLVDVVNGIAHAGAPIFKIEIYIETHRMSIADGFTKVGNMLFRRFA